MNKIKIDEGSIFASLVTLIVVLIGIICIIYTSPTTGPSKEEDKNIIEKTSKWSVIRVDSTHIMCVPEYNSDNDVKPFIIEIK